MEQIEEKLLTFSERPLCLISLNHPHGREIYCLFTNSKDLSMLWTKRIWDHLTTVAHEVCYFLDFSLKLSVLILQATTFTLFYHGRLLALPSSNTINNSYKHFCLWRWQDGTSYKLACVKHTVHVLTACRPVLYGTL